ncbi:hypothetical protein CKO31_10285 [Thiohalocapsa halophila]|jgi:hypothetical protein|uniref:Fido domain-containing protein n=1 Tax=Thiohalocapsa halophila TaxID=69359 RepID=A0ABS1CHD4_9GAMM|nr:hypothetical protein [Thiohalocapsa halophila]MBK1631123.1 hypothetical protein [Thiohalocapsa halophila]NBC13510.1 hypothetical protein [Gammaproteobacteria bacterium]
MAKAPRLNLPAIEESLRAVQHDFEHINRQLETRRDPLSDAVIEHMMLGYAEVDALLAERTDPFELGNSGALLALNFLVICGTDRRLRGECAAALTATEERFYAKGDGGFESLAEYLALLDGETIWRRAAGAYIHVLSEPQLYIEGNHRTGALIMSWMLAHAGKPPFVLSVNNAKAYFDPSSVAKDTRKHSLRMLLTRPKLLKSFAALLKDGAEKTHLLL